MRPYVPVLLAVAAAGCLAPAPTADLPLDPVPDLAGLPLSPTGCTMVISFFPIAADAAARLLPEGFTPEPWRGTPFGQVATWAWTCTDVPEAPGEWREMVAAIRAAPPEEWRSEDAAWHAVLVGVSNWREDVVARYAASGIDAEVAQVTYTTVDAGLAADGTVGTSFGGSPFRVEGTWANPQTGGAGVVRVFSATDGEVTGAFEYVWTEYTLRTGLGWLVDGYGLFGAAAPIEGVSIIETGDAYDFELRPVELAGGE